MAMVDRFRFLVNGFLNHGFMVGNGWNSDGNERCEVSWLEHVFLMILWNLNGEIDPSAGPIQLLVRIEKVRFRLISLMNQDRYEIYQFHANYFRLPKSSSSMCSGAHFSFDGRWLRVLLRGWFLWPAWSQGH